MTNSKPLVERDYELGTLWVTADGEHYPISGAQSDADPKLLPRFMELIREGLALTANEGYDRFKARERAELEGQVTSFIRSAGLKL